MRIERPLIEYQAWKEFLHVNTGLIQGFYLWIIEFADELFLRIWTLVDLYYCTIIQVGRLWRTVGKNTSIHFVELNQDEEQNSGNVAEFEVEEKNCWIEGVEDRSLIGFATSITGGVDSIYATEKGAQRN